MIPYIEHAKTIYNIEYNPEYLKIALYNPSEIKKGIKNKQNKINTKKFIENEILKVSNLIAKAKYKEKKDIRTSNIKTISCFLSLLILVI